MWYGLGYRIACQLVVAISLLAWFSQPGHAACAIHGGQFSQNSYLQDIYLHPGTICAGLFNPASRVIGGSNSLPSCGTWAVRPDVPGFQYTSGSAPCFDWLAIRIQMPDQGVWDYFYSITVFPSDDPLP